MRMSKREKKLAGKPRNAPVLPEKLQRSLEQRRAASDQRVAKPGPLEEVGGTAVEPCDDDGADPHRDRAVAHQVVRITLGEAAIGLVASAFATKLVEAYLLNVSPMDPVAFIGAVAVLMTVTTFAAIVPARRAGSADPLVVLRAE